MASCRRYILEQKIRFLDIYEEIGSVAAAAREIGIARGTCRNWVQLKDQLRTDYERSLLPIEQNDRDDVRIVRKIPLEEKIKCIKAVDVGMSIPETARQYEYHESSIRNWYKTRDALLALYYTQNDANEVNNDLKYLEPTPCVVGEDKVPRDEVNKDLSKKIKTQAKEIEYLKDKIALLENLNKIIKERTEPVKKKIVSQQSNDVSNREEKT